VREGGRREGGREGGREGVGEAGKRVGEAVRAWGKVGARWIDGALHVQLDILRSLRPTSLKASCSQVLKSAKVW
jgi:hypothetical protein